MKNFTMLSIFTISLLTSAMGFCSHFDSDSDFDDKNKQIRKGYDKSTQGSLQFACAKVEADCKAAQDKQKPRSIAPKATTQIINKATGESSEEIYAKALKLIRNKNKKNNKE